MPLSNELLESRWNGLSLLHGDGIEIGAFDQPSRLPAGASVRYVDVFTRKEGMQTFPEVDSSSIVDPDVISNLDKQGLGVIPDASADFVIACHVLEHLANPIGAIAEMFRVLKRDGCLVVAVPDKRFTFDKPREITSFEHLWLDYLNKAQSSDDDHYSDFLSAIMPLHQMPKSEWPEHIQRARRRNEHAHVWDSNAFADLLLLAIPLSGHRAKRLYESSGDVNRFEYFCVWRKSA
ncbi:MAG: methyltransferase domain-containing protein [Opitutaceae bacterium]